MGTVLIGAFLFIFGILAMVWEALARRRLSRPPKQENDRQTLEPRHQGLRFLGPTRNWLGVGLTTVGGVLLLFGALRYALV